MAHVCHRPATNRLHHARVEQTDVPNQRQTHCNQNCLQTNASRYRAGHLRRLSRSGHTVEATGRQLGRRVRGSERGFGSRAEAELRMFEDAIDALAGSMLPEAIDECLPFKEC